MNRFVLIASLSVAACYQAPGVDPGADGPGTLAWGSAAVTCNSDSDCNASEACMENVCQLRMCTSGPYTSSPPIGRSYVFLDDLELVAASAQSVASYETGPDGMTSADSWNTAGDGEIAAMTGGNVLDERPEEIIVLRAGATEVEIVNADGGQRSSFDFGFVPTAIATGDSNNDGIDEIVALGPTSIKVCDIDAGDCQSLSLGGGAGIDVAFADVDGDSRDEPIVLKTSNSIVAFNLDVDETGQRDSYTVATEAELFAIAAGDLDGDGRAEVLGVERDDCTLLCDDDIMHVYHLNNEITTHDGAWPIRYDDVLDIEIGDTNGDFVAEAILLREESVVVSLEMVGAAQFSTLRIENLPGEVHHLALADADGDSPMGRLVEGPELVSGRPIPLFAAFYPPYWREHSATPANVFVGNSELETESHVQSVALYTSKELGVEAELAGFFSGSVKGRLQDTLYQAQSRTTVQFVGNRLWTQAQPDIYGPHYGAVMTANNCYHAYTYEMDDPADKTNGGDRALFSITTPVDGKTAVLSTMRFNAIARELGDLPIIEVPHAIGDPSTYPTQLQTLAGEPVPEEDILVPVPPSYQVSEVGYIGFWLALWEYVGTENASDSDVGVTFSASVPGFSGSYGKGTRIFRSHRLEIGRETVFGGNLPTISDDPTTPEDEYTANLFSFAPIVYRDHYLDASGNESSYFVFHYMVGD